MNKMYEDIFRNANAATIAKTDSDVMISNFTTFCKNFGIQAEVSSVKSGPIITRIGFRLGKGVPLKTIRNVIADLELAMHAKANSIRLTTINESGEVAIEIPNKIRGSIDALSVLSATNCTNGNLNIGIGVNIIGEPKTFNLAKAPHVLTAGTTGSGKSVFFNTMICNLIMNTDPTDLRLILIDPKGTEMGIYNDAPHLLHDVVRSADDALKALEWCVEEMERRYTLMTQVGAKDLKTFNEKVKSSKKFFEMINDPMTNYNGGTLPYIVVIVDEFADLMACSKNTMETAVKRMAAKARAAGIHLILATQRPSVDVVSGVLKSNLPTRIALKLSSPIDSMTIIGGKGAEALAGNGDMIIKCDEFEDRMHGFYISDAQIENIVSIASYLHEANRMAEWCNGFNPNIMSVDDIVAKVRTLPSCSLESIMSMFKVGTYTAMQVMNAIATH